MNKQKIHWVRKQLGEDYTNIGKCKWYYDWISACGYCAILNSTAIRKNVTCKKCLKIMQLKGKGLHRKD